METQIIENTFSIQTEMKKPWDTHPIIHNIMYFQYKYQEYSFVINYKSMKLNHSLSGVHY